MHENGRPRKETREGKLIISRSYRIAPLLFTSFLPLADAKPVVQPTPAVAKAMVCVAYTLNLSIISLGLSSFVTGKRTRGPDACESAEGISALSVRQGEGVLTTY